MNTSKMATSFHKVLFVVMVTLEFCYLPVRLLKLWLFCGEWGRSAFIPHLRIQLMHNIAMAADYLKLAPFYMVIRLFYRLAIALKTPRAHGRTIYLGRETECVFYSSTNKSVREVYEVERGGAPNHRRRGSSSPAPGAGGAFFEGEPGPMPPIREEIPVIPELIPEVDSGSVTPPPPPLLPTPEEGPPCPTISAPPTPSTVFLVVHGGGFIYGSPETVADFSAGLMSESGYDVVVMRYPLAPQNPYPAALLQLYEVYRELVYLYHCVHVVGVSAGANLALSLTLLLRNTSLFTTCHQHVEDLDDISLPLPDTVTLVGGTYSLDFGSPSYVKYGEGPKLTRAMMAQYYSLYLAGNMDLEEAILSGTLHLHSLQTRRYYRTNSRIRAELNRFSPLRSPYAVPLESSNFQNLPPMLLVVADKDILFDDTMSLFRRIDKEQGAVKVEVIQGPHIHLAGENSVINRHLTDSVISFVAEN